MSSTQTGKQASKTLKIGTRGSALALYQAELVQNLLIQEAKRVGAPYEFEIVVIKTTGDKILDRRLSDMGGKALFTKEIDLHLLDGHIDIAVHSMKDCETWLPPAFQLAAILEREDPRDVFISQGRTTLDDLPSNAVFGTCSLRRTSQVLHLRPDLQTTLFRGNIQTRLQKIESNEAAATMLALAGLNRMGLKHHACQVFSPQEITPCAAQGAIGAVCLKDNAVTLGFLQGINHQSSFEAVQLERGFLERIDGHCGTPVGALVTFNGETINFVACVATLDGQHLWRENLSLTKETAHQEIFKLGKEMKQWLNKHGL
ncbi:MAG TPA: hydroxymethylbilane synthase [Holosporales bacterium]|nr:hydroxymethylbilane synthase [Holosporales bacterium]